MGIPITLQLGGGAAPKVGTTSLLSNGQPFEFCEFDAANYRGDDPTQTYAGRSTLQSFGAIVLVPRARLHSGETYSVSIVANGKQYNWKFTIGDHAHAQ
jgi:hypothetical protein